MAGKLTLEISEAGDVLVSIGVLSGIVSKTSQQISQYIKKGMPAVRYKNKRLFSVKDSLDWMIINGYRKIDTLEDTDDVESLPVGIRRDLADAKLKELKLRQAKDELVPRDEVNTEWFQAGRSVRDGLLAIPTRISPVVAANSDQNVCKSIIDQEIRNVLEGLQHEE